MDPNILEAIASFMDANKVSYKWQKGDIFAINNRYVCTGFVLANTSQRAHLLSAIVCQACNALSELLHGATASVRVNVWRRG